MEHAGLTKDMVKNMPELTYVKEDQYIVLKNNGEHEEQDIVVDPAVIVDDSTPFNLLLCSTEENTDGECARTADLTLSMSNTEIQDALMYATEPKCTITGAMFTDSGFRQSFDLGHGHGGETFWDYDVGSFCGPRRVLAATEGHQMPVFSKWINHNVYPGQGNNIPLSYAEHACFAVRGFVDSLVFYMQTTTKNGVFRGWWFTHMYDGLAHSTSSSWTFHCVDLLAVAQNQIDTKTNYFPNPEDYRAKDFELYHMKIQE